MAFRLSGDQNGAGFGFLTKAGFHDKLVHIFGSAFWLVIVWTLFILRPGELSIRQTLQAATVIVFVAGVGLEIWQGIKGGRRQRRIEEQVAIWIEALTGIVDPREFERISREIKKARYDIEYLDGFSVRDLLGNAIGIVAVWTLYYTLFIRAIG